MPESMVDDLPERLDGIYFLYRKNVCIYIGESDLIRQRLKKHRRSKNKWFDCFSYFRLANRTRLFTEKFLIKALWGIQDGMMEVKLKNKEHAISEPQVFRGTKKAPQIEKIKAI